MATKISRVRSARDKYPWKKWTLTGAWRVRHGREFQCSVDAFRKRVYAYAALHGYKARVSADATTVEFRIFKGK